MRLFLHLAVASVLFSSCRCGPTNVGQLGPAKLTVAPSPLALMDAYLGQPTSGVVSVTNLGGAAATLDVSIGAPFTVEPATLTVTRGDTVAVTVRFTPSEVTQVSGVLKLGALEVPVTANGLAVPPCAQTACTWATFDFGAGKCVSHPKEDGAACQSPCVSGTCLAGACLGQAVSCDDGDACTLDACSEETGCTHPPRVCPQPATKCQTAICDSATGCGGETAIDGTLCGPDDCAATTVEVCIVGQCVQRPRPDQGRCVNTWMPVYLSPRYQSAIAFDAARKRTVLFGGAEFVNGSATRLVDTWEWDGAEWKLKTPASSPPGRWGHAMVYDPLRQRVMLFGGGQGFSGTMLGDTWEWDGTTWLQRPALTSPPPRSNHALAFDSGRNRLVLFGGNDSAGKPLSDTWEWDGTTWTLRVSASAPGARANHAMAYDPLRHRTVLLGGSGAGGTHATGTWEWDGATWLLRPAATAPSDRIGAALTWDPTRLKVVLVGGLSRDGHPQSDTWEWDGVSWAQRTLPQSPPELWYHTMTYDGTRGRLVLLGGPYPTSVQTWELDAVTWARQDAVHPVERNVGSLAWDSARGRLVVFGGWAVNLGNLGDTWEWDGTTWQELSPALSPSSRSGAGCTWDPVRQRVVLFGGAATYADPRDTWEWDGTTWLERAPVASPPGRSSPFAFDVLRSRALIFGGEQSQAGGTILADTWEWDGQAWLQKSPALAPSARYPAVTWDGARQKVILFGGSLPQAKVSGETWLWDGASWSNPMPTPAPPARRFHALAYDPDRQKVLLFGGEDSNGPLTDTWEWDGTAWLKRTPAISPPSTSLHAMTWDEHHRRIVLFGPSGMWWFLP